MFEIPVQMGRMPVQHLPVQHLYNICTGNAFVALNSTRIPQTEHLHYRDTRTMQQQCHRPRYKQISTMVQTCNTMVQIYIL